MGVEAEMLKTEMLKGRLERARMEAQGDLRLTGRLSML